MSPKVTEAAVRRALRAYGATSSKLDALPPAARERKSMQAALKALAEHDKGTARVRKVGRSGQLTVMIFEGEDLMAIGEGLSKADTQSFLEDLWGARRIIGEFPPDVDK